MHDFDLLRWLTGREVEASSGYLAKHILPEYPTFYDAAGVQVFMAGGITAQLYADWHARRRLDLGRRPDIHYGDARHGRNSAGRRSLLSSDEVALVITDQELRSLPLTPPAFSLSQDFLNRVEGEAGLITHDDIYKASEATVTADEGARI